MQRKKARKAPQKKYDAELLLGKVKTGMLLPKNTGNWFSFRIRRKREVLGVVEIGRGSIRWQPKGKHRVKGRSWLEFATRMQPSERRKAKRSQ